MTNVGKVDDWHNQPIEEDKPHEDVHLCPPRNDQGVADQGDLCPVKRKDTHSQAVLRSE